MSWNFYLGSIAFFTVLFAVFSAIAFSIMMGVRDNYRRYYQKADLQWTGTGDPKRRARVPLGWLLLGSLLAAWGVVHWIIHPS